MATARKATRFTGVQARESSIRRHNGRPDVCYTIDYRDPATGSRIRRDVGWLSEGITAQLAAKIRQEAIQAGRDLTAQPGGEVIPAPPAMSLDDAYQRYRRDWLLAHGKRTQMEDTLVRCHLQELLPLPLDQITPYVLDQLMARMRGQGRSPQTIRHAVSLIRRVMRRMVAWELYNGPLPFRQVNMPRPDNARQRYLTPSEAHRLLAELHARSRQTWLMALISLHCGLRFSEVARLRYGYAQSAGNIGQYAHHDKLRHAQGKRAEGQCYKCFFHNLCVGRACHRTCDTRCGVAWRPRLHLCFLYGAPAFGFVLLFMLLFPECNLLSRSSMCAVMSLAGWGGGWLFRAAKLSHFPLLRNVMAG